MENEIINITQASALCGILFSEVLFLLAQFLRNKS